MIATELLRFTPTQRRMLAVLADGQPHARRELRACLFDELGTASNIRFHLCSIRKVLRPLRQDIICELHRGTIKYRHVRLLG